MPRGFLVKRTKRSSYRSRDTEPPRPDPSPRASGTCPHGSGARSRVSEAERAHATGHSGSPRAQPTPAGPGEIEIEAAAAAASPGRADASHSPTKPVGSDQGRPFFERCLSSPAAAESFPTAPPAADSALLLLGRPSLFPPLHQALKRSYPEPERLERRAKPACKKAKAGRKLSFEDEVTISPVLGLQIKKEGPEPKAARRRPLGEFICQLCKEEYPDPFALAQHRCSRIVRVEYRCPECDKVFSCPANLASHRRWHKPRPVGHDEPPGARKPEQEKRAPEGKENSTAAAAAGGDQHHPAAESDIRAPQRPRAADGARAPGPGPGPDPHPHPHPNPHPHPRRTTAPEGGSADAAPPAAAAAAAYLAPVCAPEELFECRFCDKTFRRHAYLRKHLSCHEPSCGHAAFPQILACRHCPATFLSSPGLARHTIKAHPAESRQVMLLQVAIRPGC